MDDVNDNMLYYFHLYEEWCSNVIYDSYQYRKHLFTHHGLGTWKYLDYGACMLYVTDMAEMKPLTYNIETAVYYLKWIYH